MNENSYESHAHCIGNNYFLIQTLGDFSVAYNEINLTDAFENSQKLLELFTYFITYRNELILPEKIIDEIWPESEFSDPKRTLRALIFRLRKILSLYETIQGSMVITYSNGCYKFNAQEFCEIDIDTFETTYKQATELHHINRSESIELYEHVIQMYHGGYFNKMVLHDWLIPIKNQYHHMFLQSCGEVLDYLADEGRNQEIIKLSEEIMRLDVFSEYIHLHYVDSLTKLGELMHAKNHVAYVQKIFDRDLGLPSSEFIKKMNDLINHNTTNQPANLEFRSSISKLLHDSKGPILCNYNFFKLYQKIEVQRSERLCKNMIWGTITICESQPSDSSDIKLPDSRDKKSAELRNKKSPDLGYKRLPDLMEMLRVILVSNLRKGDVISQNLDMQFSVSLSTDNLKHAEKAFERIQKKFSIASASKHISVKMELYQYPDLERCRNDKETI